MNSYTVRIWLMLRATFPDSWGAQVKASKAARRSAPDFVQHVRAEDPSHATVVADCAVQYDRKYLRATYSVKQIDLYES